MRDGVESKERDRDKERGERAKEVELNENEYLALLKRTMPPRVC